MVAKWYHLSQTPVSGYSKQVRKVAVILFPQKVDQKRLRTLVDKELARTAETNPTTLLWLPTSNTKTSQGRAWEAVKKGASLIIVVGGDGTARGVFEVVQGTDVEVALIPVGTGNVLARNLGIPLNSLPRSVQLAFRGTARQIDLGIATLSYSDGRPKQQHVFAVMAGLGLPAKIMMNANTELKRRFGWVAYIDAGMRAIPLHYDTLDVSVNGRASQAVHVVALLVGNCGFLPGPITLMQDAKLDDGILDLAAVGPRRWWNWIDFWNRVTWISQLVKRVRAWRQIMDDTADVRTMENLSGRQVEVWAEHAVAAQLDGDPFGMVSSAKFEALPKALKIRCP